MTERLNSKNKVVGAKQVRRALNTSEVQAVYIASDAEKEIISDIVQYCEDKQIQIVHVNNMKELGVACGIDINAATAALLK